MHGQTCRPFEPVAIDPTGTLLGATGFDPPTLTALRNSNATQCIEPEPEAAARQECEPSQVLGDGGQNKLILGTSRATQSEPTKPQDALQVCEPHLDLLALTSRLLEAIGAGERPGNVSGMLMDVARDLARWFFWAALRFERAYIAVELTGRYRSVLPSCTVPLVPSRFPPGQW